MRRHTFYRIIFLVISAMILYLAVSFEYFSEESIGAKSVECRISPFYEHIEFSKSNQSSFPNKISITITPFMKTTYLQIGSKASLTRYVPSLGKLFIKEYFIENNGKRVFLDRETIKRGDINSDYYSPLLHKNGSSSTFGIFTHFGTYSVN